MFLKLNFRCLVGLSILTLAVFLLSAGNASAAWQGPSSEPPIGNVPAPLNVNTLFNGEVRGTYDSLKIQIANCSSSQVLVWENDGVKCEDVNAQVGLFDVLSTDPNASAYGGGVIIGTSSATWLNLGGALTAGWFHSTEIGDNSLAGNLGIGIESPNAQLHIYNINKNAEIDLQSISGDGNHWAIYHKSETDDLRFWNQLTGDLVILGGDKSLGVNGSLLLSSVTPESKTNKLYNSEGSLYWNGSRIGMGVYVGKTTVASAGNIGGYAEANKLCDEAISGSRVCFNFEMVNSITSNVQALKDETGRAWVMTGAAGNQFGAANDCRAFQSSNEYDYGTVWNFNSGEWGSGFIMYCNETNSFACCK